MCFPAFPEARWPTLLVRHDVKPETHTTSYRDDVCFSRFSITEKLKNYTHTPTVFFLFSFSLFQITYLYPIPRIQSASSFSSHRSLRLLRVPNHKKCQLVCRVRARKMISTGVSKSCWRRRWLTAWKAIFVTSPGHSFNGVSYWLKGRGWRGKATLYSISLDYLHHIAFIFSLLWDYEFKWSQSASLFDLTSFVVWVP